MTKETNSDGLELIKSAGDVSIAVGGMFARGLLAGAKGVACGINNMIEAGASLLEVKRACNTIKHHGDK
jgi:hypothetical protein